MPHRVRAVLWLLRRITAVDKLPRAGVGIVKPFVPSPAVDSFYRLAVHQVRKFGRGKTQLSTAVRFAAARVRPEAHALRKIRGRRRLNIIGGNAGLVATAIVRPRGHVGAGWPIPDHAAIAGEMP